MKSILCDINFFLDIFLKREPFYSPSGWVFKMVEEKKLKGYLCALCFPTLYYLLSKELKREKAIKILEKVRIVFHVSPVDERIIDLALTSNFRDFEDAIAVLLCSSGKIRLPNHKKQGRLQCRSTTCPYA